MKISLILMTSMAMTLQLCEKKNKAPEKPSEVSQIAENDTPKPKKVINNKSKKIKSTKAKFAGKKLHPEKQFCVNYDHKGMGMSGTSEMCSRKHGQESYTIEKLKIGMGGFSQDQNKHTVIYGDKIYTSETGSGTWMVATNPMYAGLTKGNPEDLSKQMMAALGMSKTGETEIVAGTKCYTYNSAQMGGACFTKNMVMLRQSIMGMEQIATKVDIGSAGDNAKYARPKNASEAPNIDDIMKRLGKQ